LNLRFDILLGPDPQVTSFEPEPNLVDGSVGLISTPDLVVGCSSSDRLGGKDHEKRERENGEDTNILLAGMVE